MPPKTVSCFICGLMVPKAQTVARADGNRICRSHPGAEGEAQKLREKDQQRRAKAINAKTQEKKRGYYNPFGGRTSDQILEDAKKFREEADSHCWTCGRKGITLSEYYIQCLITQKRLQLRGEWNFLSLPEDMAKLMGHQVVLAALPYDDQKDGRIRHDITNRKIKDIIHFIRYMNICIECIDKYKVRDRLEALMPHPTQEQVKNLIPVVIAIDPLIEQMAKKKESEN